MKKFIYISLILTVIFSSFSFTKKEKSIDKLVQKIWKTENIKRVPIKVPDSLKHNLSDSYILLQNDKVIGYACYTTAYGCQVGGCAKPKDELNNEAAQAYETFDYIVVFDANFSIKKIEIAQYPGAYGYQICRRSWLKQFTGKTPSLKLNEDIDGVSGATVSAQFLIDDLNTVKANLDAITGEVVEL